MQTLQANSRTGSDLSPTKRSAQKMPSTLPPNLMKVTVVSASNLAVSHHTKVNPIVKVKLDSGQTYKSRQCMGSAFPKFEQSFLFMLPAHPMIAPRKKKKDLASDTWTPLTGSLLVQIKHKHARIGMSTKFTSLGQREILLQDIFQELVHEDEDTWDDVVITKTFSMVKGGKGSDAGRAFGDNAIKLRFHFFNEGRHPEVDSARFVQGLSDSEDDEELEDASTWNFGDDDSLAMRKKAGARNDAKDSEELLKEAEEERKEQETRDAEQQAVEDVIRTIKVLEGVYQLSVHVIEARDLKGHHEGGYCNPVCEVKAYGQSKTTCIQRKALSVVFDTVLPFELPEMTRNKLDSGSIEVSVYDAPDSVADGKKLVGTVSFDFETIYYALSDGKGSKKKPVHERHREWFALANLGDPTDGGVTGYVKLSITLLGPEDELVQHNLEEDLAAERELEKRGIIAKMPTDSGSLHFLVLTLYEAQGLPSADGGGGIDTCLKVLFANNPPFSSTVQKGSLYRPEEGSKKLYRCHFRQQLWMPTSWPSMSNNINIAVYNFDSKSKQELVATCPALNFKKAKLQQSGSFVRPFWINLYGSGIRRHTSLPSSMASSKTRAAKEMNEDATKASVFKGRILIGMRRDDNARVRLEQRVYVRKLKRPKMDMNMPNPIGRSMPAPAGRRRSFLADPTNTSLRPSTTVMPAEREYTFRAAVYAATEIPSSLKELCVEVSCGHSVSMLTYYCSNTCGVVEWPRHGNMVREHVRFPEDLKQMPDIFVYLKKKNKAPAIAFIRLKAKDIIENSHNILEPKWYTLTPDEAVGEFNKFEGLHTVQQTAGYLLFNLQIFPSLDPPSASHWPEYNIDDKVLYDIQVNLYQARGLPSADPSGLCDPYWKVTLNGEQKKSKVKRATIAPIYYETLVFRCQLPKSTTPALFPHVNLYLYDEDLHGCDDYIGVVRIPLCEQIKPFESGVQVLTSAETAKAENGEFPEIIPSWRSLQPPDGGKHDETDGDVLLSVRCLPVVRDSQGIQMDSMEPPSIIPEQQDAFLDIISIGCRDLQPASLFPLLRPFMKYQLSQYQENIVTPSKVKAKRENGEKFDSKNPNFLEKMRIPIKVPISAVFAPTLRLDVMDKDWGGRPYMVGLGFVSLENKIPLTSDPLGCKDDTGDPLMVDNPHYKSLMPAKRTKWTDAEEKIKLALVSKNMSDLGKALKCAHTTARDMGIKCEMVKAVNDGVVMFHRIVEQEITLAVAEANALSEQKRELKRIAGSEQRPNLVYLRLKNVLAFCEVLEHLHGRKVDEALIRSAKQFLKNFSANPSPVRKNACFAGVEESKGGDSARLLEKIESCSLAESLSQATEFASKSISDATKATSKTTRTSREAAYLGTEGNFKREEIERKRGLEEEYGRRMVHGEFPGEIDFELSPFQHVFLYRGTGDGLARRRHIGSWKGVIRITYGAESAADVPSEHVDLTKFMTPIECQVRLYVLKGSNLIGMDTDNLADPYLKVTLGNKVLSTRKYYIPNTIKPDFYHYFEFTASFPGTSSLNVEVYDYDFIGSDDLIGRTVIDLEDRWFSDTWNELGSDYKEAYKEYKEVVSRKPLETRTLESPASLMGRGCLSLWVDILPKAAAKRIAPDDISLPEQQDWELRLIIWKTVDIPPDEGDTWIDMFCKARLASDSEWKETDVHYLAKEGAGSFNFRIKFTIKLPPRSADLETFGRLNLQVYDWDITSPSDLLWRHELNFADELLKASETNSLYKITPTKNSPEGLKKDRIEKKRKARWEQLKNEYRQQSQQGPYGPTVPEARMTKEVQKWAKSVRANFGALFDDKKAALMRELMWDSNGKAKEIEPSETTPLDPKEPEPWWATCFGKNKPPMPPMQPKRRSHAQKKKSASKALAGGLKDLVGMGDDPDASQWVPEPPKSRGAEGADNCCCSRLCGCCCPSGKATKNKGTSKPQSGNMLISLEVLPKMLASTASFQAGDGRSEPNQNPKLPPPAGRIDPMQLMNPFFILGTLAGPEVATELCCCFGCLFFLAAMIYVGPLALDMTQLAIMLPNASGVYLFLGVTITACLACGYIMNKISSCCCGSGDTDDDGNTLE